MYFDNLTIAGLVTAGLYLLLPLLFGRELVRVEEESDPSSRSERPASPPLESAAEPCGGA
jgi:hypothetical protein